MASGARLWEPRPALRSDDSGTMSLAFIRTTAIPLLRDPHELPPSQPGHRMSGPRHDEKSGVQRHEATSGRRREPAVPGTAVSWAADGGQWRSREGKALGAEEGLAGAGLGSQSGRHTDDGNRAGFHFVSKEMLSEASVRCKSLNTNHPVNPESRVAAGAWFPWAMAPSCLWGFAVASVASWTAGSGRTDVDLPDPGRVRGLTSAGNKA